MSNITCTREQQKLQTYTDTTESRLVKLATGDVEREINCKWYFALITIIIINYR